MGAGTDTIAAVATPPGRGGIGIVRLSGPDALRIGEAIAGRRLRPRHAHHCVFRDGTGEPLDDGLVLAFPGPASFTGEDVVELQGHGGTVVLQRVLRAALAQGARLARPGEFSERAFLNDRIDLVQAEAIADLVAAGSEAAARGALRSLQGVFSERVHALVDAVTALRVYVEAALDFPDEDVDFLADEQLSLRIDALRADLEQLLAEVRRGARLAEGMTLVLAGAPNAGKSSLMNALSRRETAIVTEVPGTTRDVLREGVELDGLPVHLVDTAGLRETEDRVEAEGVRRARREIEGADVLLYLLDVSVGPIRLPDAAELEQLLGLRPPSHVVLVPNKIDLPHESWSVGASTFPVVPISARSGTGVEALVSHLKQLVGYDEGQEGGYTARTRHVLALEEAARALLGVRETLEATRSGDLVAEELRRVQDVLGQITGAVSADELLGRIFSSFCIGK